MNLTRFTDEYLRSLETKIRLMLNAGNTNRSQLLRALSDEEQKYLQRLQKNIFLSLRVEQSALQRDAARSVLSEFSKLTKSVEKKVVDEIFYGIKKDVPQAKIVNRVREKIAVADSLAKTLVRTANRGISNAETLQSAEDAGMQYFKYSGSQSPERIFCRTHLNKVYSLAEIQQLDNGQGLPVQYFCGGYNCRHFWVAVGKEEKQKQDERNAEISAASAVVANKVEFPSNYSAEQIKSVTTLVSDFNKKYGLPKLSEIVEDIDDSGGNAYYHNRKDSIGVGRNVVESLREYYREGLPANASERQKKGFHSWYYSNNLEDVVVHELGHRLHNLNFDAALKAGFTENGFWKSDFEFLTERGRHSHKEAFAEYYSLHFHGAKIPIKVKKLFKSMENNL